METTTGTKRTIIWFKLQVHGYLEAWLLVSIRVYKLKKSILLKQEWKLVNIADFALNN